MAPKGKHPGDRPNKKLTPNEKKFANEWLIDHNGTRAYKAAFKRCSSDNTARTNASKKLTKANIKAYIQKKQQRMADKYEISQERVLKEYAKLAFLDPQKLFDKDGHILSIQDIPKEVAAAIGGMDISQRTIKGKDDPEWETIKKIKLIDKKGALDSLSRHLGLFERDNAQKGFDALAMLLDKIAKQGPPKPNGDDRDIPKES